MIRVKTIDELEPALRNRIKARVMRRLIDHLRERPEVEDAALRRVFGFDRAGLDALYAALSQPPAALMEPEPANDRAPGPSAPAESGREPVRACCAARARD